MVNIFFYLPACSIIWHDQFGSRSVMVWEGISLVNASWVAWCWTVSTGPTKGRQHFIPCLCSLFFDSWVRNMYKSSQLEVILQNCGIAPHFPPCTKEQILVWLLVWFNSPHLMAHISSIHLRICWQTQQTILGWLMWMCHLEADRVPVQHEWAAGTI